MSVCQSVHSHISKATQLTFTNLSVHVVCGRGLVLQWQCCDIMLCTSGYVDNNVSYTMDSIARYVYY